MDDNAEKKQHRRLVNLERQAQARRDDFVRAAVTTREGREYIYWLLELARMGRNPFTSNALTTAFACGELNVGQQVQAHLIEVAPNAFLKMLAEKEEERLNARSDTDTSADSDAD
jgi:hypothetical protein